MSVNRARLQIRRSTNLHSMPEETARREQAEQLLNEIDNLAILLHEVRKQTDRIEAAADCIGDAVLSHLDIADALSVDSHQPQKNAPVTPIRPGPRSRASLPRAVDVHNA